MTARGPGLPPGGVSVVAGLAGLSAIKAIGLLLIAEGVADAIGAIADGSIGWEVGSRLAAAGVVLRAAATWGSSVLSARGAIRAKTLLRRDVAANIVATGSSDGSSAVLATEGLDGLDDYYGSVISAGVQAAVVPAVLLVRILTADWLSALVVAVTIPLVPVFMILIGMYTRDRSAAASRALDRLSDHLAELARGLPVLVGLGRIREQTEALQRIQTEYRERTRQTLRIAFLSSLALELIATLSVAVVAVLLGVRLLAGDLPLATALLVLILAPDCFAPLREVGAAFHSSQNGRTALDRVRALLAGAAGPQPAEPAGTVMVEGLRVRYPGRSAAATPAVTAEFPDGTVTALTGASGSGKSMLLAALTRTLPSDARTTGAIHGVQAGSIGYCPQAPRAFAATVREELRLYGADDVAADELLGQLGLRHVADLAPAELSPGELRRVAVARALLRVGAGARLLLLDEPTAHLDDESAQRVRDAIASHRGRAAVILVSHDPATLAMSTRQVALDATRPPMREPVHVPPAEPMRTAPRSSGAAGIRTLPLLLSLMRPDGRRWIGAVAWGVLAVGLGLSLTAVSAWLIVRAGAQVPIMYLMVAIVGVRFFGLGRSTARYVERLTTHGAVLDLVDGLRMRLWEAIARRGAASRTLAEGGTALDYLVTVATDIRETLPRLMPLLVGTVASAGVAVAIAFVTPALAPLAAPAIVVTLTLTVVVAVVRERTGGRVRADVRSSLVRQALALGDASADLRANGVTAAALTDFAGTDATRARLERAASWTSGLTAALAVAGTGLAAAALPAAAGAAGVPADLAAVAMLLLLAAADPIAAAGAAAQRIPALRATLTRLGLLLRTAHDEAGSSPVATPVSRLDIEHVAARWPGTEGDVFSGATAKVETRQWLGVRGPSGSGKSTLLTVLLGALPPRSGRVSADGRDIRDVVPEQWAQRIAWCPQDAHVFDSTIRANLLIARPRTDPVRPDEMQEVLGRVGLGELLAQVDDGLDARVGSGGRALSGGERQRLAVARALLSRCDILLLDEPTAHLDEPTAERMMDDIRCATGDRMVVLVSHRSADHRAGDLTLDLTRGTFVPARGEGALVP